jgi:hypothetical protein
VSDEGAGRPVWPTRKRSHAGRRRDRLVAAGFPPSLAARLAADGRRDVHELIELVDRGCPPRLATRILAPIDEEPTP